MQLQDNPENLNQIAQLVQYAFLKDHDLTKDQNFLSRYQHSLSFGEIKDGHLASYIMVNKFKAKIFNHDVKMGGVGYVASYPENRGQGDINRLMHEIILELKKQNYAISNLAPFSESFYRRYGYENAIFQKEYHFKDNALQSFKPITKGKVIRGKLTDSTIFDAVLQLYQDKMDQGKQCNTVIRDKWWWERFNTYYPSRYTCVYLDENQKPRGYMFYQIKNGDLNVDEIYYQTPPAAKALMSIVASHASSNLSYHIKLPEDTLLNEFFPNQDLLYINTFPYMMTRIIDMKQVLAAVKLTNPTSLIIEVSDDNIIDSNNGIWKLTNLNGKNIVEKTNELPNYIGTLTNWTKVLLGHLTLSQAVNLGFIQENRKCDNDFVKGEVSFYDYF